MLLILLVLATAQAPAGSIQEQEPPRAVRVGERVTGELPLRVEQGRNAAETSFELALDRGMSLTVTLESLDFDAWLSITGPGGGIVAEDRNSGAYTDAWLVHEANDPAKLRLVVRAEDPRGGEFTLSVLPGRVDPPQRPLAWTRATVDHCEAAATRARARGEQDRSFACLKDAWQFASLLGDHARAKSLAELHLREAEKAGVALEIARGQAHLGAAERRLGNVARGNILLESARAAVEEALAGAGDPEQARKMAGLLCLVEDNLGDAAVSAGLYGEALVHFQRFVEVAPRAGFRPLEIQAWQKLGGALADTGDLPKATQAMEKALAIAESSKDPRALGEALLNHAQFLVASGRPVEARLQCQRALSLSPLPPIRIELLGTLASACLDLGRYENSIHAMDELESLCRERGVTKYQIPTRINRAVIALRLGHPAAARALLEEALGLPEAGGSTAQQVDLLLDLGIALQDSGEPAAARARYEEALEICERVGDEAGEAKVLLSLGKLFSDQGEPEAAESAFDRSVEVAEKAGERIYAAAARGYKGYFRFLQKDFAAARPLAVGAAAELEALGDAERAVDAHDTLARIGLANGDLAAVEEALCAADRLLEDQSRQRLERFAAVGLRSRFADWGAIAQDLAAARVRAAEADSAAREAAVAEGFRQAGRWKGRALLEGMQGVRISAGSGDTLALGKDEAVVEYADGLERLYAYVLAGGSLSFLDLGESAGLEDRTRALLEAVSAAEATPEVHIDLAAGLHARLLAPVLARLPKEVSKLTIIPTSALSSLPFECLIEPPEAKAASSPDFASLRFLVDRYCVTYAPSSPVLAELRARHGTGRATRCLILGDPVFGAEAEASTDGAAPVLAVARPGSSLLDYGRLPRTRDEAVEIARLLLLRDPAATPAQSIRLLEIPGLRSGSMAAAFFDLRLGADARADALHGDLSAFTDLHIAAHALVDPADPRRSGLLLSFDPASNGLFPLEDVLGLELDADLVVLSACDTARGPIVRGEGVESVAYAFLEAGSRAVVASLWKLEDSAAADLMKSFYRLRLSEGMSPAQALRSAKLEFRKSRGVRGLSPRTSKQPRSLTASNPYFWAPFVFVGTP